METLNDIIAKLPLGFQKDFSLVLWIDTDEECKPVTQDISFNFPVSDVKLVKVMLVELNKVMSIISIKVDNVTYHVTAIEQLMNKSCEV